MDSDLVSAHLHTKYFPDQVCIMIGMFAFGVSEVLNMEFWVNLQLQSKLLSV